MPRRIEVELTSERADGTWTWRAAGAKQPKGDLDGALLFSGAKVGDVVRADADFDVDGITIIGIQPPKDKPRNEPERIEVIGSPQTQPGVTTALVGKGDRRGRPARRDDDRGERRGRGSKSGDERARGDDQRRERRPRSDRPERAPRPPRPAPEAKPRPKRLRAGRAHRQAVVATMAEEHKAIAEQVLRGGIPAVRQAIDKQNEANKAEGKPAINPAPIVAIAEDLLPQLRTAEWRDRAEAALAEVDELDLRDLRSVVVAADVAAKDDETRALAEQLRQALNRRVEAEHAAWLAEIDELLRDGRVVRALRVSSRPPKAGTPFPVELGTRLAEATAAALTSETGPDRFATVIDALAYAPIRQNVKPQGVPEKPTDELRTAVERLASRIPQIATAFGMDAPASPPRRPPRPRGNGGRRDRRPTPPPPRPPAPAATAAAAAAPAADGAEGAPARPTVEPPSEAPVAPEASAATEAPDAEAAPTAGVPVNDG